MQETQVQSPGLGREDSLRRKCSPFSILLPGEFHGQKSRASYSPWDPKELDMTNFHLDAPCGLEVMILHSHHCSPGSIPSQVREAFFLGHPWWLRW